MPIKRRALYNTHRDACCNERPEITLRLVHIEGSKMLLYAGAILTFDRATSHHLYTPSPNALTSLKGMSGKYLPGTCYTVFLLHYPSSPLRHRVVTALPRRLHKTEQPPTASSATRYVRNAGGEWKQSKHDEGGAHSKSEPP